LRDELDTGRVDAVAIEEPGRGTLDTLARPAPAGRMRRRYAHPPATSGRLTAAGTVVKAGSRIGFTEGRVSDASGNLVATATSTLLVFELGR
jgi:hypothetical protein